MQRYLNSNMLMPMCGAMRSTRFGVLRVCL